MGRISITDELKKIKLRYMLDYASDGMEAVEKFKILLNRGYAFDFIFMDIYLREMSGFEATKLMRQTEREYNFHTNIACVTVEGKNEIEVEIFDEYCNKLLNFSRETNQEL